MTHEGWLTAAVELSRHCVPSPLAYSVGAIIVSPAGAELARGFSRETGGAVHAEEVALSRVRPEDLVGATLYSSLEPCGVRRSRPAPCARLIVAAGLATVVFALREPPVLAPGGGASVLRAAGLTVLELPGPAGPARTVNAHLFGPGCS